jgi:hypothetical protein
MRATMNVPLVVALVSELREKFIDGPVALPPIGRPSPLRRLFEIDS